LEIGNWELEIGNCKLEIGYWELEIGNLKLQSQSDKKYPKIPSKINNILSKNDDMNKKSY
jgi:hypothetical protein